MKANKCNRTGLVGWTRRQPSGQLQLTDKGLSAGSLLTITYRGLVSVILAGALMAENHGRIIFTNKDECGQILFVSFDFMPNR